MPPNGDASLVMTDIEPSVHRNLIRVNAVLTADSGDGSFAVAMTTKQMWELGGYYLYNITTYPGDPAPTDQSDLEILDSVGRVILSAAGNGQNLIDATSTLWVIPDGVTAGSTNHYPVAWPKKPWTVTMTNNSVNSAIVNMILELAL